MTLTTVINAWTSKIICSIWFACTSLNNNAWLKLRPGHLHVIFNILEKKQVTIEEITNKWTWTIICVYLQFYFISFLNLRLFILLYRAWIGFCSFVEIFVFFKCSCLMLLLFFMFNFQPLIVLNGMEMSESIHSMHLWIVLMRWWHVRRHLLIYDFSLILIISKFVIRACNFYMYMMTWNDAVYYYYFVSMHYQKKKNGIQTLKNPE